MFSVVMDRFTVEFRQETLLTTIFADNTVICSESRVQVEESLGRWRYAPERRVMKVSRIE